MTIPGGILRVSKGQLYQACYQTPLAKCIVQMPACVYQMLCNPPFEIPAYGPVYVTLWLYKFITLLY